MQENSPGLLATGTSCLALVCVIGRRRVPRPPERISPFSGCMLTREATSGLGRWGDAGRAGERGQVRRVLADPLHLPPAGPRAAAARLVRPAQLAVIPT